MSVASLHPKQVLRSRLPGRRLVLGARSCSLEEQLSLAGVSRERRGTLQLGPRLLEATELDEEVAAHRWQQVVVLERALGDERVDEIETGLRTRGHRHSHGAV